MTAIVNESAPSQILRETLKKTIYAEPPPPYNIQKSQDYELFKIMDEMSRLLQSTQDCDPEIAMSLTHCKENLLTYVRPVPFKDAETLLKRYGALVHRTCELAMKTTRVGPQTTLLNLIYEFIRLARSSTVVKTWRNDKCQLDDLFNKHFTFVIPPEWFLEIFLETQEKGWRDIHTAMGNVRNERLKAAVAAATQCRNLWDSSAVGAMIEEKFKITMIQLDSYRDWLMPYCLHIMVSQKYAFEVVKNKKVFDWWSRRPVHWSEQWDSAWVKLISRGVKHGWAIGEPLDQIVTPYWPRLLSCLTSLVPNFSSSGTTTTKADERIEWDINHFTKDYPVDIRASLACILIYCLRPITQRPADASKLDMERDLNLKHFSDLEKVSTFTFDLFEDLMKIITPYCHPSSSLGRLETDISVFVSHLTSEYLSRVGRERSPDRRKEAGYDVASQNSIRLGRLEDLTMVNAVFTLAFNGVHRKGRREANSAFLAALTDCCSLCPEVLIPKLTAKLLPAFENVTEPYPTVVALGVFGHLASKIVLYQPQALPVIFNLVQSVIDVSDPQKTIQAASTFEALATWARAVDFSTADYYGFDWSSTTQVLTPMFGYKTSENKHLFDKWTAAMPYSNLQAYPDERLNDDVTTVAIVEAPNVSSAPSDMESVPAGYQDAEQIQCMIAQRAEASGCFATFIQSYLTRWLDIMQTLKIASALQSDKVDVLSSVFEAICDEVEPEIVETMIRQLAKWVVQHAKAGDSMLYLAFMKIMADKASFDVVAVILEEVEKVLLVGDQLNASIPFHLVASIGLLLAGAIRPRGAKYLPKHMAKLAKITWLSIHYFREPVFKMGMTLFVAITTALVRSCVYQIPLRLRGPEEDEAKKKWLAFQWCLPSWMGVDLATDGNSLSYATFTTLSLTWRVPTSEERDLAFSFVAQIGCGSIERLLKEKLDKENLSAFGCFDPKAYRKDCCAVADKTMEYALPEPRVPAVEELETDVNEKAQNFLKTTMMVKRIALSVQFAKVDDDADFIRRRTPEIPLDEKRLRHIVLKHTTNYILACAKHYIGLNVNGASMEWSAGKAEDETGDVETAEVQNKLVALASIAFQGNIWKIDTWRNSVKRKFYTFVESSDGKSHYLKGLVVFENANNALRVMAIKADWITRVAIVAQTSEFKDERRDLVMFLYANSVHLYSEVRQSAQKQLGNIQCLDFQGMRPLLQLVVREFIEAMSEAKKISPRVTGSVKESDAGPSTTTSGSQMTQNKEVTRKGAEQSEEERKAFVLHVKQTGCSYMLMTGHLWHYCQSYHDLTMDMLLAIVDRMSVAVELETLKNRLMYVSLATVYSRSICPDASLTRDFLIKLTDRLEGATANDMHWRAQCMALTYINCFMSESGVKLLSDEERARLFTVLVSYCGQKGSPLVAISATYGLTKLMKMILSKRVPEIGSAVIEATLGPKGNVEDLFTMAPSGCTITDNVPPNTTDWMKYHVIRAAYLLRPLPVIRIESSSDNRHFPHRGLLYFQSLFQLMLRRCGAQWTLSVLNEKLTPLLKKWCEASQADAECHWAIVAVLGGLLRASRKWDIETRTKAFNVVANCLTQQSSKFLPHVFHGYWDRTIGYLLQGMFVSVKIPIGKSYEEYTRPNTKCFPDGETYFIQLFNLFMSFNTTKDKFAPLDQVEVEDNSELSSQVYCRRFLVLRRFLSLGRTYIQGLIEYASPLVLTEAPFTSFSKKVREEWATTANSYRKALLKSIDMNRLGGVAIDAAWTTALKDLDVFIYSRAPRVLEALKQDAALYRENRDAPRSTALNEVKSLLSLLKRHNHTSEETAASENDVKLIEMALEVSVHPDDELVPLGKQAGASLACQPLLPFATKAFETLLMEISRLWQNTNDWNRKQELINLAQLLHARHRIVTLMDPNRFNFVLALYERGLRDDNVKVSEQSKQALSQYAAMLSHSGCEHLCKEYLTKAGTPATVHNDPGREKLAAIQGLASVIETCALDCPYWLPPSITSFAKFGSKKCPDLIRSSVEKTLQNFFKTHLSDWDSDYKYKFTEAQTDILNEYKGIPIYFS